MRVRHAAINSAEDGKTFVGICRVSRAKIRRQTVRAEGKPAPFSAVFARRDFRFSNFVYVFERLADLSAMTTTVIGVISVSIKGVSQGGSAARFAGAKNAACSEWRTRASDR